jgi:hypothetical protein
MIVRSTARTVAIIVIALNLACARSPEERAVPSPSADVPGVAGAPPLKHAPRPTTAAITEADLMTRLYVFADDSMEGREFGARGNVKGTDYIARELQRIGLEPAGENGTWFQAVPMHRRVLDPGASLRVGGDALSLWTDFAPIDQGETPTLDGAGVIYGGVWGDSARLAPAAAGRGKVVVLTIVPGPGGQALWSASRPQIMRRFPDAAGFALATLDAMPANAKAFLQEPQLRMGEADTTRRPAFFWVTTSAATRMLGRAPADARAGASGGTLAGRLAYRTEPSEHPARNVVAILRGRDPALRGTYVAIGSHNDHVGIAPEAVDHDSLRAYNAVMRPLGADDEGGEPAPEQATRISAILDSLRSIRPVRRDSIFNGADDDGSGSVAMLEMAEAMASLREKPRRSVLFIWHTGEEAGLLGAEWFTDHPTIPRDSIVTGLNIDMIGRGRADDVPGGGKHYLQLIGSRRLSQELGDLVEAVNREGSHGYTFDYQFDANGHPGQYYCRSDHYEYARYGIPVTFFSSGSHRDYHMVTDEPQYIDYGNLFRVTRLIHDVALRVANLDHRPALSAPKPDPEGQCVQ